MKQTKLHVAALCAHGLVATIEQLAWEKIDRFSATSRCQRVEWRHKDSGHRVDIGFVVYSQLQGTSLPIIMLLSDVNLQHIVNEWTRFTLSLVKALPFSEGEEKVWASLLLRKKHFQSCFATYGAFMRTFFLRHFRPDLFGPVNDFYSESTTRCTACPHWFFISAWSNYTHVARGLSQYWLFCVCFTV